MKMKLKKGRLVKRHAKKVGLPPGTLVYVGEKKIEKVLTEIDRVLKPSGKLIFFESKKFLNWDIAKIQLFFNRLGYHTQIHPLNNMPNKCIFIAKKP